MTTTRLPFVLSLAIRDLRGGLRGFWLLLLCLALGVAAIGAVGLLSSAVDRAVARDARALLGGDIVAEASGDRVTRQPNWAAHYPLQARRVPRSA